MHVVLGFVFFLRNHGRISMCKFMTDIDTLYMYVQQQQKLAGYWRQICLKPQTKLL